MSSGEGQQYFGDGITDDIITDCRDSANCVFWHAIPRSNFVGKMSMSVASAENSVFSTCWKVASAGLGIGFASLPSSSTRHRATMCGPNDSIGSWRSYSLSRIKLCGQSGYARRTTAGRVPSVPSENHLPAWSHMNVCCAAIPYPYSTLLARPKRAACSCELLNSIQSMQKLMRCWHLLSAANGT